MFLNSHGNLEAQLEIYLALADQANKFRSGLLGNLTE